MVARGRQVKPPGRECTRPRAWSSARRSDWSTVIRRPRKRSCVRPAPRPRRRWRSCAALVRGINPPVLTERGVVEAVRALALESPIQVDVLGGLPGRPERPIEAAVYFAVAELLTNVAKHARATWATVEFGYSRGHPSGDRCWTTVSAALPAPKGRDCRRIGATAGRVRRPGLTIQSPAGGGTRVGVAVPCALS